jgi:hypothetical protein
VKAVCVLVFLVCHSAADFRRCDAASAFRYGIVKNDDAGITHGLDGSSVHVALALQYFVEGSRLQLHASRKSGLPGFYDVAPAEDKVLYVLYRFKGKLHEVFVDDEAPLLLPLKAHCLPDAAQRRV